MSKKPTKYDVITERLTSIDNTLIEHKKISEKQQELLDQHISRTNQLEEKILPLYNWGVTIRNNVKTVTFICTVIGGLYGVMQIVKYIM